MYQIKTRSGVFLSLTLLHILAYSFLLCLSASYLLMTKDIELRKLNTGVHFNWGVPLVPSIPASGWTSWQNFANMRTCRRVSWQICINNLLEVGHGVAKALNLHSAHLKLEVLEIRGCGYYAWLSIDDLAMFIGQIAMLIYIQWYRGIQLDLCVHRKIGEVHGAGCLDGQPHAPQNLSVPHDP